METKQKILLVDDNRQNIQILMELFRHDYRIVAATSAERALKIVASEQPPDIILLDILMPDMDGYQLCKVLKDKESSKNIPVIFVTAVSEVMDEARGFDLGAVDYITKPFHPPAIKARVGLHLELKRKQEQLERYAFIDALTNIPNRRRFDEVLHKEWDRAQRSHQQLSLIMIDIDYFKNYNDRYGHGKGDDTLRQVAQKVEMVLRRAGDFIARYGGEEFVAVLPYTDIQEVLPIAEQIKAAVADLHIEHCDSPVADHITVSLGVVSAQPDQQYACADTMLQTADKALYRAKSKDRNCIEVVELKPL
ncbi:MAG: diguanylate cyclase [Thermodesulfobacteriota bacterium]|nr:diguanylate cyclase [Thermodesulfobacteriota bacterium]